MLKKSIITFFGIGNLPVATGTFASFFSLILLLFLNYYLSKILFIIFFIILLIISFFLVKEHIVKLDIKDSKEIVIDEVLGIYFILLFIKIDYNQLLLNFLIIFLLFRFFDISKIFPMNIIEKKYDNAFGIIADDLVAGFFSVLCYLVIYNFIVL
tara:strand:+ start:1313 stop:1777 length:465 start_codon:yes stop_codon:yes gene_type:complete